MNVWMEVIIKRLVKITHLDAGYFMRGGFWATLQQCIGVASGLVLSYFFGHYVSQSVFGEYNLLLSVLGMLTFLSLPGIEVPLIRSVSMGYSASLFTSARLKLKLSFAAIPVLLGFCLFYFLRGQMTLVHGLLIAIIAYPFLNTFTSYTSFFTGKSLFRILTFTSIGSSIFFLLIHLLSIRFFPDTTGLITAYLIGIIVPSIISYRIAGSYIKKGAKSDPELPRYGSFVTLLSVLPWISGHAGSIVLGNTIGVESLAVYAVAGRFLTAVQKNFIVFYKPLSAKLAAQSQTEHRRALKLHGTKLLLMGIGLCAILWVATPLLIRFFFGAQYEAAIKYGQLLSLALIPFPLTQTVSDMLIYEKRKVPQILIATVPQLMKIVLILLITPIWKIEGLIAITLIDRFIEPVIPLASLLGTGHKKPL